jgi:ribosomal-protein-alanine N-acetyltransferase
VSPGALDRVQTTRLVCARTTEDHLDDLATLLRDPLVAKTLSRTGEPATEAEVRANLDAKLEHWNEHGYGFWMLYDRATGAFVGRGGLQQTVATGDDEVEIGWAIVPDRWGEGLATELALASIEAGFGTLALDQLIAFTLVGNLASRRVMEKAGLSYERNFQHVGLPHVLYRRVRC